MKKVKALVKHLDQDILSESFILEALTRYAKDVLEDDSDWGNSFVSKEAWQGIASKVDLIINN